MFLSFLKKWWEISWAFREVKRVPKKEWGCEKCVVSHLCQIIRVSSPAVWMIGISVSLRETGLSFQKKYNILALLRVLHSNDLLFFLLLIICLCQVLCHCKVCSLKFLWSCMSSVLKKKHDFQILHHWQIIIHRVHSIPKTVLFDWK